MRMGGSIDQGGAKKERRENCGQTCVEHESWSDEGGKKRRRKDKRVKRW